MSKGELSTDPYKGVRDFYPADWAKLSAVFAKTREILARYGYEEYQASPLEPSELYEKKGNEEIIREQTFTFEDRGGRRVTLRPEMTPTLARMVAAKRRELSFPLRWFSIGNRFRYERPQRGRLREFFQTDVDLIGLPEGEADMEIISLASEILKSLGASENDFVIKVNSRKLLNLACKVSGLEEGEASRAYWQLVDKKAKMSATEFEEERTKFSADPLAIIESDSNPDVTAEKNKLLGQIAELKKRGVTNVVFDTDTVRGFEYYTGIVFELFDTSPENPRALFGGGRYDGLVALFGGDPIPAVGFAIGDVTLLDFLETHGYTVTGNSAPQVYIGTPQESDVGSASAFAKTLRDAGVRTFVNLTSKSLGDQIKDADKRGIPLFVAYGANEAASGTVKIKTLASGAEEEVTAAEVPTRIAASL